LENINKYIQSHQLKTAIVEHFHVFLLSILSVQGTCVVGNARETKSLRPLCTKQEFYYAIDSGKIHSQNPELQSESGDELCTASTPQSQEMVYVTRVLLQYIVHRWSERQANYRETSWLQSFTPTPLQNLVTGTGNLAEPS
jgi:hypothetical protein